MVVLIHAACGQHALQYRRTEMPTPATDVSGNPLPVDPNDFLQLTGDPIPKTGAVCPTCAVAFQTSDFTTASLAAV